MDGRTVLNLLDLLVDALEPPLFQKRQEETLCTHSRQEHVIKKRIRASNLQSSKMAKSSDQSIGFVPPTGPPSNVRARLMCFRRL